MGNDMMLALLGMLLLAGCVSQMQADQRAGISAVPDSGDGSAGGDAIADAAGAAEPPPALEDAGAAGADARWGTECVNDWECDMKEACEYGACVEQECVFSTSCQPEKDHCFNGKCYTEQELYAEFEECGPSLACDRACENCASGKESCTMTGHGSGDQEANYYICVGCSAPYHCKEGHVCMKSRCVKGPE